MYLTSNFKDHLKKHQRLKEADMKKKAIALEAKRERVGLGFIFLANKISGDTESKRGNV